MKKGVVFLLLLGLMICSVSAVNSDFNDSYQPRETAIGKISGNILEPILKENIELKRKNVLVPIDYDVKKIGDDWIVWFIAPENQNNYTLLIKDISTTINGVNKKIDYEKNFSVGGQIVDYNINPGALFTQDDFSIDVNLFLDNNVDVTTNFPSERNILLKPGSNKIDFSIESVQGNKRADIGIGKYVIPAYIIGKEINGGNNGEVIEPRLPKIRFRPRIIQTTILADQVGSYPFYIINSGDEQEQVDFEYDKNYFDIGPENNSFILRANENREFNITLKKKLDKNFNGTISAKIGNQSIDMPIEILIAQNLNETGTPYLESNLSESTFYYCSELNGKLCATGESCSVDSLDSLDGACCVGICSVEAGSSWSWIGWLIGAVILIILVVIWGRYKKAKGGDSFSSTISRAERNMP